MADPGTLTTAPLAQGEPAGSPCRNCGAPVPESYCPRCGQHRDAGVVSLRRMAAEFLEDQLTLDSALPRTLGALLFRPGWLTREYAAGRVVRYVRPFRLFLVATVLHFVAASLRIEPHLEGRVAAGLADAPAEAGAGEQGRWNNVDFQIDTAGVPGWLKPAVARVQARQDRLNSIPPDALLRAQMTATLEAATRVAFLLVPAFALLLLLLHWRQRRLYTEHFVFALHFHAAAFLLLSLALLVDHLRFWVVIGSYLVLYLLLALRSAYHQPWWRAGLKLLLILMVYPAAIGTAAGAATLLAFFLI